MKILIKQYKQEKVETGSQEFELPAVPSYYFETGIRRSIRIIPIFTSWNRERFGKDEELYQLDITCVYDSFQTKIERFIISASELEGIYYNDKNIHNRIINSLFNKWLDTRTEDRFNQDLKTVINNINKIQE
jgi:hypothetical protein